MDNIHITVVDKIELKQIIEKGTKKVYCCYCEKEIGTTSKRSLPKTLEHVIPKSRMKINEKWNFQSCCIICNAWKSNKVLTVWLKEVESAIDNGGGYTRTHNKTQYHHKLHSLQTIVKNIKK